MSELVPFSGNGNGRHIDTDLLWKGFVAGLVGGLAGMVAKEISERVTGARPSTEASPRVRLANRVKEKVTGDDVDRENEPIVDEAIHWSFGALVGGVYGTLAEVTPRTNMAYGLTFSTALFTVAYETSLPLLNLKQDPRKESTEFQLKQLGSHWLYGVTMEFVRRQVRRWLD